MIGKGLGEGRQPAKPNIRPRRTTVMHNRVFVNRYGNKFESPDPAVLSEIMTREPRVRYFGVTQTGAFNKKNPGTYVEGRRVWGDIQDLMASGLAEQVSRDFPDHELVVRGTKVSLNGVAKTESGGLVLDIEDVVNAGEEWSRGWFRATLLNKEEKRCSIAGMSISNAADASLLRRHIVDDGAGPNQDIFPTLLVYNKAQLDNYSGHGYRPLPGAIPLLAAYILDCPII